MSGPGLQPLGIAAMSAKGATIAYPAPITRDGPGWRADVDLPFGVTGRRRARLHTIGWPAAFGGYVNPTLLLRPSADWSSAMTSPDVHARPDDARGGVLVR